MTQFYRLTPEIGAKLRKAKLTAAEWRIWSYLIEIDPWGDRYQSYEPMQVWAECNCSKATFYRAIAKFQKLELFDFQFSGATLKNEAGVSKLQSKSQKCNPSLKNETGVSKMRLESQKCESQSQNCDNRKPEPPSKGDSGVSQTLQTYSDFIQTLSDERRESFKKFCDLKVDKIPFAIASKKAWLEKHWPEYWEEFKSRYPVESKVSAQAKSSAVCKRKNKETLTATEANLLEQAVKSGEIRIERWASSEGILAGVRSLTSKKWWDTLDEWLEEVQK